MKLDRHIATRFLTDPTLAIEVCKETYPDIPLSEYAENIKTISLIASISPKDQKAYYCTETVLNKLDMLQVKRREDGNFDWEIFKNIEHGKKTFILPDNKLLRVDRRQDVLFFAFLDMKMYNELQGYLNWHFFFYDFEDKKPSENFDGEQVRSIDEFVYKLMCFVFLTENDEIIVASKGKHGTKKEGKLINTLPFPLTIINSRWNTTSIRTESFGVRGHFAIRWSGEGRTVPKLVFINPFVKNGYVRKAPSGNSN